MRIILDDHEINAVDGGAADALQAARDACEAQGRVITDVFLDDRHLDGAGLDALVADNPPGDVLRCTSTDPYNLVVETFEYVGDALDQVGALHKSIADHFQGGEMAEGLNELKEALALWNSVRQGVEQGCMLVNLDVDEIRSETAQVDRALSLLAERLDAIRNAVSNQDWSSLADTLGYEMEPVVDEWRTFIEALGDHVESMRESGGGS
jgi:hypothetical protein